MFTDMVGYTRLGQRDEPLSLVLVNEQRKLLRPIFKRHNGRQVKTMGDAFLAEFPSALDAVRCAYDIQRAAREFNFSMPEDRRIILRVGIHLGDVLETRDGDISGDAVNVASRLEPLASPGGVCLTRQVFDHVQNKFDLKLESLGLKTLKNVTLPIELFKMKMPWETAERAQERATQELAGTKQDRFRIAVLPFSNMSPDRNDEYFSDGMTEEMISTISKIGKLQVIARTSVMGYKGGQKRIEEIARELNVGTILEGSVRKAGDKLRITAQLVNAEDGRHLWSESYDRELRDVFAIQSEIADRVAAALRIRLLEEDREKIRRPHTTDPEAYDLYLKGLFHMDRITQEEYMLALQYFERAIRLDANFALAYANIAIVYNFLSFFEMMPAEEAFAKSERAASMALRLDDSLPEAHQALAFLLANQWKYDDAMREMQRALDLNPNLAGAHQQLASYYLDSWQYNRSLKETEKALEIDPMSARTMQFAATSYLYAVRPDKAAELYRKVLEIDPENAHCHGNLGLCYVKKGMYDSGIAEIRKSIEMSKDYTPPRMSDMVYALVKAGRREEARDVIPEMLRHYKEHRMGTTAIACAYASLGDKERAFEWLEKAYSEHSGYLRTVSSDFAFEEMHSEPRFLAFVRKLGLIK